MALTSSHWPFKSRVFSDRSQKKASAIQSMKGIWCTTPSLKMEWVHSKECGSFQVQRTASSDSQQGDKTSVLQPQGAEVSRQEEWTWRAISQPPDENLTSVS